MRHAPNVGWNTMAAANAGPAPRRQALSSNNASRNSRAALTLGCRTSSRRHRKDWNARRHAAAKNGAKLVVIPTTTAGTRRVHRCKVAPTAAAAKQMPQAFRCKNQRACPQRGCGRVNCAVLVGARSATASSLLCTTRNGYAIGRYTAPDSKTAYVSTSTADGHFIASLLDLDLPSSSVLYQAACYFYVVLVLR